MLGRLLVSRRIRSRDALVRARAMDRLLSLAKRSAKNRVWAGKLGLKLLADFRTADAGLEIFRRVRPESSSQALFERWLADLVRTGGEHDTKVGAALHMVISPGQLRPMLHALEARESHHLLRGRLRTLVDSCVRNFRAESLETIAELTETGEAVGHERELRSAIVDGFVEQRPVNGEAVFTIEERHLTLILDGIDGGGRKSAFFADLLDEIQSSSAEPDHARLQALVPRCLEMLRRLPLHEPEDRRRASTLIGLLVMLQAEEAVLAECRGRPGDELWLAAASSRALGTHGGGALLCGFFERICAGGPDGALTPHLFHGMQAMLQSDRLHPDGEAVGALLASFDPASPLSALPLSTLDLATLAMRISVGDSLEQVATSLLRHTSQPYVRELLVSLLRRHAARLSDAHLQRLRSLSDRDTRKYREVHYDEGEWRLALTSGELYDFQAVRSLAGEERERRRFSGGGRPLG